MFIISALSLSLAATATQPAQTLEDFLQQRALQQSLLAPAKSQAAHMAGQTDDNSPLIALAAPIDAHLQQDTLAPNPEGRRNVSGIPQKKAGLARSSSALAAQDIIGSYFLFNDSEINSNLSRGRLTFEATTGHIQLESGSSTFDWHIDNENFIVITPHKPILVSMRFRFMPGFPTSVREVVYIDQIEFRFEKAANGTVHLIGDQLNRSSYPDTELADVTSWGRFNSHALAKSAKVDIAALLPLNKQFSLPFSTRNTLSWNHNGQDFSFNSSQNNLQVRLLSHNSANTQNFDGKWGVYIIDANGELEYRAEPVTVNFNANGSATFADDAGISANVFAFKRPSDEAILYNVLHTNTNEPLGEQLIARESISFIKNPQLNFSIPGIYQVRQNNPFSLWWLEFNEDGTAMQVMYNYANNRHSTFQFRWQYGNDIRGNFIELRSYRYHSASGQSGTCISEYFEPPADANCKLNHSETLELFDIKTVGTQNILQTNRYFTTYNNTFAAPLNETKKLYGSESVSQVSYNMLTERPMPFPTQTPLSSVQFSDQQLQQCINSTGKTYLEEITSLYCQGVQNIEGLDKLSNLEDVILFGEIWNIDNPRVLSDLSPLTKLNRVKALVLDYNNLTDAVLQTLSGFKFASFATTIELGLSNNKLTEASLPLIQSLPSSLNENIYLMVSHNQFKHVDGLANLKGLTGIHIGGNPFTNSRNSINQFAQHNLRALGIQMLGLTHLDEINLPANLAVLDISFNPLSSLTSLVPKLNPNTLETLQLSYTQISNLSSLTVFNQLRALSLGYTPVTDISALANLPELSYLDLNGTKVSTIEPLLNLPKLSNVSIAQLYQLLCDEVSQLEKIANLFGKPDICRLNSGFSYQLSTFEGQTVTNVTLAQHQANLGQLVWQNGILTFTPSTETTGAVELDIYIFNQQGGSVYVTLFVDVGSNSPVKSKRRGLPAWLLILGEGERLKSQLH